MNRYIFLSFCILSFLSGQAQELLTQDKAIEMALVNNNLLQASKKLKDISSNDVTLGNAGFLPTINATGNVIRASNNQNSVFFNGNTQDRKNAQQLIWNAGISANWVIFNGMRRANMYQRLNYTFERADAQTKTDIQNTVAKVSTAYYETMRQQEIVNAYQNTLDLFTSRLKLAEAKVQNGLASKSDVLLTKVDINTQRSLLIRQQSAINNAKIALNIALNQDPKTPVIIPVENRKPTTDTTTTFSDKSPANLVTEKSIGIAQRQYKETNAAFMPILSANAGYNFTKQRSEAGQLLSNRAYGPTAGLTLSWSLFDGFNKNRISRNAQIQVDISKILHEDNKRNQQLAFEQALEKYKASFKIFELETDSYSMAKESNEIAKERYESGRINLFEYKETQKALEDSKIRLANARFDALIAEIELKRINGELIK